MTKRPQLAVILIFTLTSSAVFAGSGYDACRQEERYLLSEETQQCGGMSYILNPTPCFRTRKALVPYAKGKCRTIAANEGGVEKKSDQLKPVTDTRSVQPARGAGAAADLPEQPGLSTVIPVGEVAQPTELELLRREVEGVKAELKRLREELHGLKGGR